MEVDLSRLFKWSSQTYSLESFVDDHRNTFPRIIHVVGGNCPDLEKETLKVGQILILQEVQREQFVVLTQSSGTEHFIPCKCPVKVELVPLDRLDEKYATVEELFVAQPDYFRVVDDIPSFGIKSGSVMKICSRQNGVYHLECEAVGKASRQEIVKLPLALHGRFLPLHDAREYLLEEFLARYPPPSKIGVRLINSSSTRSLPFSPETQLPLGSGLKVERMLHDDTIIATALADKGKEVLLFPKTFGVNIVPAVDVSVKSEQLWSLDCLEQTKVFSSLCAYHAGSCRLHRYNIEDLTTLSLSEPCDILPNLHEPEILQTTVYKGELGMENNSVDEALTNSHTKQPCSGEPFYAVQGQERSLNTTILHKNDTYDDLLLAGPHTAPPQPGIQKIEAHTLRRPEPSFCTRDILALSLGPRSLSESDLSKSSASAGDDNEYEEVLLGSPRAAPPQPGIHKIKTHTLSRPEPSYCARDSLPLPLGPRPLSENDLSTSIASAGDDNEYEEVLYGSPCAAPPQPGIHKIKTHTLSRPEPSYCARDSLTLPLGPRSLPENGLSTSSIASAGDDNEYEEVFFGSPRAAPPQPGIHKIKTHTLSRPEPSYCARNSLTLPLGPRSLPENGLSTSSIASAGDDNEYEEVFFGSPRAALPQPKHSKTPVDNQMDHISDTLSTLVLPFDPKSLSEIDLSRNVTSEENGKNYEVPSEGTHPPTPQPSGTRNMLPLPLGCRSLSKSDLHGLLAPDEGHSQFDNPISNPKTFPRVCRQKNKPLPTPPCCKRPSEGSSLGMESSNSDKDEGAYSAMSLDIGDSEYTEMENKVCKDQTNETERWSRGKEGPNEIRGRSESYCYAYQHFWFNKLYRRQHSDNITDKITSKSMERDNEKTGGSLDNKPFFARKKSRSEEDFRNVFSTTNVGDLDDCCIELLADTDPEGTYLEPVDSAISGAAELQVDGPDATNCKQKTIFGSPRAALPQPKHSKTPVDNQVDHISDTLSTLVLPFDPKSLSEIDLSRNVTSEESGKKCEVPSEGAPTPQPSGTRNMLPLPLGCRSLSESDLHGLLAPDEGHSQFDNPISNPKTFPWVCRERNKPLPPPACCKRPSEGSSLGMESSNSDKDEGAYSAMSLDIDDSEYTEMENKVCKDQTNETERWSRGKEGPNEIHGRSGSYWYAYQHFWFHKLYRRQHSDNITDKITSKSMERDKGKTSGSLDNRPFFARKKSRSEEDFRNVFSTTNVGDLDDCCIELLADTDPEGIYLEPVDSAISGAAELQVDGPDATNCKRKTIGVERQESHERRTSRDGGGVCDCCEICPTYSLPYQHLHQFLRGGSKSMSDGAYTEKFAPLPSWPVHIDDQSHVWVKPADKTTIEDNSSTHGSEICQCPSSPTSSNGQCADKSLFLTFPPSQVQKDIWETADYPPEETGKEEGDAKNVEDKEQENIEDPCNEELISVMGEKVQIDAHGPSSFIEIAQEKPKDDGKKTRVNAKVKKAQRLQKSWAQHQPIRRKMDPSSGNQENMESGSGEKKLSPTANVDFQNDFLKGCKKDQEVEAKIKQSEESEKRKKKPLIQRFVKTKHKKRLINAKFQAELSRVMNSHARAQQNLATPKDAHISFGPKFRLPTATVPSFDEQSDKHTRDGQPCPKSKKAPAPTPKRKKKS